MLAVDRRRVMRTPRQGITCNPHSPLGVVFSVCIISLLHLTPALPADETLSGTTRVEMDGDIASQMIDGIDAFLLRETAASVERRERHWHRDVTSAAAYQKSVEPNRARLRSTSASKSKGLRLRR